AVVTACAVVAAVMDDLAVARAVGLDQRVAVHVGAAVVGRLLDAAAVGLGQVELAVAALDPVVAHHAAGAAVFQVVAAGAAHQRAVAVVLVGDVVSFAVGVVLVDRAADAVAVDVAAGQQNVLTQTRASPAAARRHKEAVAAVGDHAVAHGDVLALLNVDRAGAGVVRLAGRAGRVGVGVVGVGAADFQVFDRHPGGRGVCVHAGAADHDHAAVLVPEI